MSLEGRSCHTTCSSRVPPHKGQQFLIDWASRPRPADGCRLIGPPSRQWSAECVRAGRCDRSPAVEGGSTAHFEAPVVPSGSSPPSRIAKSIIGAATTWGRSCASSRLATVRARCCKFDYEHPPSRRSRTSCGAHPGKIVFNKTYWHTVPKGRVWRLRPSTDPQHHDRRLKEDGSGDEHSRRGPMATQPSRGSRRCPHLSRHGRQRRRRRPCGVVLPDGRAEKHAALWRDQLALLP